MNCKDLLEFLSSGAALSPAAKAHVASCPHCRAMLEGLAQPDAAVSPACVAAVQERLLSTLKPVRPLPSNRMLALAALAGGGALALLCALPFGYFALKSLSPGQMAAYYSLIAVVAIFLATAMAQDMIPGAKRTISRPALLAAVFIVLAVTVIVLFPVFSAPRFVPRGIPCLRLGTMSAAIAGIAIWLLLRRGFLTTPLETCGLAGTFAGLVGFAVLAVHCPIKQVPHILVWHMGAMAIAGGAGALIGAFAEWLSRFRRSAA